MLGIHFLSVSSKPVGRFYSHAPAASTKPISLQKAIMMYTHVLKRGPVGLDIPMDWL